MLLKMFLKNINYHYKNMCEAFSSNVNLPRWNCLWCDRNCCHTTSGTHRMRFFCVATPIMVLHKLFSHNVWGTLLEILLYDGTNAISRIIVSLIRQSSITPRCRRTRCKRAPKLCTQSNQNQSVAQRDQSVLPCLRRCVLNASYNGQRSSRDIPSAPRDKWKKPSVPGAQKV